LAGRWEETRLRQRDFIHDTIQGLRLVSPITREDRTQIAAAQMAVPKGEAILAWVTKPFLFDFKRKRVFVIDDPGFASPPPGLPVCGSDDEVVAYLLSQSIRYVIHSYAAQDSLGPQVYQRMMRTNQPFLQAVARQARVFHDTLVRLVGKKHALYDDGNVVVLDLAS